MAICTTLQLVRGRTFAQMFRASQSVALTS